MNIELHEKKEISQLRILCISHRWYIVKNRKDLEGQLLSRLWVSFEGRVSALAAFSRPLPRLAIG